MTAPAFGELAARRVVQCREYGRIDIAPEDVLGHDGRLSLVPNVLGRYVRADFKDGELRLSALGVTGLIPLTRQITIQVRPRFPLRNLTHMVTACGYTPTALSGLRPYRTTDTWDEWLVDVLADALLAAVDVIRQQGLLRSYQRRTEESSYPHGRIDMTATALRFSSVGIDHRVQYSWFERTIDNACNRCLKSALMKLHSRYVNGRRDRGTRARISRIAAALQMLSHVSLESRPFSLSDYLVRGTRLLPESRSYYRTALDLATAILTERGISLDGDPLGGHSLPTLLVKTEDLFEEFVRLSLRDAFAQDPDVSVLDGNRAEGRLPLYAEADLRREFSLPAHVSVSTSGNGPHAAPDILFRRADGRHPLVGDVKYTDVIDYADRSELEQVTLYGIRYGSPIVMTVHPRRADSRSGLHIAGRVGPLLVTQYRVDLGAENLEAEMTEMANSIRALIQSVIRL